MKKLICVILSALLLSGCVAKPQQPTAATTAPVVAVPPGTTAAPTTPVPTTPVPTTQMKPYSAVRDGDRYLIDFPEGNYIRSPLLEPVYLKRKTLGELKKTVLEGSFTDWEKITLKQFHNKSEDGRIVIYNLDSLHEPSVPAEWSLDAVQLHFDHLEFHYNHNLLKDKRMTITFLTEEFYQAGVESLTEPIEEEMVLKREYDSTRNAETIYICKEVESGNPYEPPILKYYTKRIRTHIQTDGEEFFVDEEYRWRKEDLQAVISDTAPSWVHMYDKEDGMYINVDIICMVNRPSLEYLSSIGVKPYVEPDVA